MRKSLVRAALAATVCAAATITMAGTNDTAIDAIVTAAAADWSSLLSCSILDGTEHETLLRWWEAERSEVASLMAQAAVEPKDVEDFMARLEPALLMGPTETDAAALIAFCGAAGDWRHRMATFTVVQPSKEIRDLLGR
jgi:hypothetical protein